MDMSLLGIIVALVVLIIICYRKFNPVVGTLICVAILAIFSGLSVLDTITAASDVYKRQDLELQQHLQK